LAPLLITGFGPFLDVRENPSQMLVEHLQRDPGMLPYDARFALLEVDYSRAETQLAELLETPPALLLLTGYSHRAQGITLESRASYDFNPARPDNAGNVRQSLLREPIDNHDLDFAGLKDVLGDAGIAACQSQDAGGYLCNYTYRLALEACAERTSDMQALFVHLPAITGAELAGKAAGHMPLEEMAQAISLIAGKLLEEA